MSKPPPLVRVVALVVLAGLGRPGAALAADKACAQVQAQADGGVEAAVAAWQQVQLADPAQVRPLWQAATLLRCTPAPSEPPAGRCLRVGRAKGLYDKFVDAALQMGVDKPVRAELKDAASQGKRLADDGALTCVQAAKEALQAGQHGLGAELFEAAYVLTYKPTLLYNAARACEKGQLWSEAATYFTAYLALPAPWRDRKEAVQKLVDIQRRLASDTGDLVRKAQDLAATATAAAQRADQTAVQALDLARKAENRAVAAEQRAGVAESRAREVEKKAADADQRAAQAVKRAEQSEEKGNRVEALARQAGSTAAEADLHARGAKDEAARAHQAATQASQQALHAVQRAEQAEAAVRALADRPERGGR